MCSEGFVIVLNQFVLALSLEYAEPSCHYLIGSTLHYRDINKKGVLKSFVKLLLSFLFENKSDKFCQKFDAGLHVWDNFCE